MHVGMSYIEGNELNLQSILKPNFNQVSLRLWLKNCKSTLISVIHETLLCAFHELPGIMKLPGVWYHTGCLRTMYFLW